MKIKMAQNTVWRIPTRFFVLGLGSSPGGSWCGSRLPSPGLDVSFHVFSHLRSLLSRRWPCLAGCSGDCCPQHGSAGGEGRGALKGSEAEERPCTSWHPSPGCFSARSLSVLPWEAEGSSGAGAAQAGPRTPPHPQRPNPPHQGIPPRQTSTCSVKPTVWTQVS